MLFLGHRANRVSLPRRPRRWRDRLYFFHQPRFIGDLAGLLFRIGQRSVHDDLEHPPLDSINWTSAAIALWTKVKPVTRPSPAPMVGCDYSAYEPVDGGWGGYEEPCIRLI
ncbi:MAG: hypothetical protein C0617_11705 [Desulfuromonas sp.]|nr:hypothetical protein [Desulfuromonas sp.]PLX83197.1 MAG: hypothetical protein C0617_11705 [Desulfuromonas sp.]